MNKLIFDFKYFRLDYQNMFLVILLIGISIFLTYIFLRKRKKSIKNVLQIADISIIWILSILFILFLIIPHFEKVVFFKNNFLIITPLGLWVLILIFYLNIFIIKLLNIWFKRLEFSEAKGSSILFKVVLWILSVHFILKIFLRTYQKATEIVIFKIEKVQITIHDLIFILLAIAITALIIVFLKIGFNRLVKKEKIDKPTAVTLLTISKYFIWVFAIIIILQTIGLNLSVLLAGSAALLVGVGLGIQQVFNDFASGIILLFEREIKVGDYVEADTVSGTILNIGFRTTIMLTRDNVKIIIPNSKLVSNKVINWTKGESYARVGLDIGVAYGSDTHKVKEFLLECANEHKSIMKKPAPEVYFLDFGDSSLNFRLYFYTEKIFYRETIKSDLRFLIYDKFNKEEIQIPFPQMDIHLPKE